MEVRKKGKGRSQNQRLKLFYLLDYLLEHTDETHTVKAQEISEHLFNYSKINSFLLTLNHYKGYNKL